MSVKSGFLLKPVCSDGPGKLISCGHLQPLIKIAVNFLTTNYSCKNTLWAKYSQKQYARININKRNAYNIYLKSKNLSL
jgi:hypothetical protein